MSEIKGQLLGLLAVLLVFAATVTMAVRNDATTISQKASGMESQILSA